MNFIKKANHSLKEVQTLKAQMDKMGITKKIETFTGHSKDKPGASVTVTEVGAPPQGQHAYPPPPAQAQGQSGQLAPEQHGLARPVSPAPFGESAPHALPAGLSLSVVPCAREGAPGKLPLVARKSVRDKFEARKGEIEGHLSNILGTAWSVHVDVVGVYSYARDEASLKDPGAALIAYFDALVYYVDSFVKTFGDDGRQQLNRLAHAHVATLEPTAEEHVATGSCDFAEGKLRLLFRDTQFGFEPAHASQYIDQVVRASDSTASHQTASGNAGMSLAARQSIRDDYEARIGEQISLMRRYLDYPTLELHPSFDANYALLVASEGEDHSHSSKIGAASLAYFLGLNNQLYWKKFFADEMMREAFREAVSAAKVELRAVDAGQAAGLVVEAGTLVIRVPVGVWGQETDQACEGIEDLL